MTRRKNIHLLISLLIGAVWIINGLFAKILNFVTRHEAIVGEILTAEYSREFTIMIGVGEMLIAIWIFSGIKTKWCAWFQILLVISMNILEFILVPDLLLFGRVNLLIAILFSFIIYWNEFKLKLNVQ